MKKGPFKLKSGNKPSFKEMGSSPVKAEPISIDNEAMQKVGKELGSGDSVTSFDKVSLAEEITEAIKKPSKKESEDTEEDVDELKRQLKEAKKLLEKNKK
jgi:hypothetical protein|tara:strand:+ start:34 stop:333 length:300 start_codon:yes stop_codon:yes gene_type:complete